MLQDASELLPLLGGGLTLAAVGRYPFGERGAIFAKVGAFFWEADIPVSTSGGASVSGEPTDDGTDVDLYSASLIVRF